MFKTFSSSLLVTAVVVMPFLLSGCGPDDSNNKFTNATVQVVSTPAAPAHVNYQALLLSDE
ncbi:MAG: hypothetical protein OSB41_12330 [Kiritimatiellae bacterium]|nr:hypothetical protein [Kiritimatiellia bacterium]